MKKFFEKKELSEEEIAEKKEKTAKRIDGIVKIAEGVALGVLFMIGAALLLAAKSEETNSSDASSDSDSGDTISVGDDSFTDHADISES